MARLRVKALLFNIVLMVLWAGVAGAQAPKFVASTAVTCTMPLSHVRVDSDPTDGLIYLYGEFQGTLYAQGDSLVSRGMVDGVIACFDEQLRLRWWHTLGGPGADRVEDITIIPNEGVVVALSCGAGTASLTTYTVGDVTFSGRGNADVVTSRFDRDGEMKWARNDGAESYEFPSKVHRFSDGTIAVVGSFGSQSRFGSEQIVSGKGVGGGFVQLLTSGGEHESVSHSVSVPGSGNPDDADGSLAFGEITGITDTSFSIMVSGIGTSTFSGTSVSLGEFGESGPGLVVFHRSATPSSNSTWRRCGGPWAFFESDVHTDGVSGADLSGCTFRSDFFIVWHDRPNGRQDTILRTAFRNTEHASKARVLSTSRSGSRSLVFGSFVDTLDLPQTPKYPDAVAGSDTALPQAFVLIGDAVGEFRRVLHIPSTLQGEARSACSTAEGMAVVMSTQGEITLPDTTLPGTADGVVLMAFGEPLTGIWERGTGNWERGTGNGELGTVYTSLGGIVAQGLITREVLGALVPGTYVVQSGGRLSLCHVLSADNIAFAVPAAASRKGP